MNPEAQKLLNAIVTKDLHELTPSDISFLKARRVYLTEEQDEKYISVLEPVLTANDVKDEAKKVDNYEKVQTQLITEMKYNDLLKTAKAAGYVHSGKGAPKRNQLEQYVMLNS